MGFKTKIQRVDRPTNQSFYAIIPTALAQSFEVDKAEEFEGLSRIRTPSSSNAARRRRRPSLSTLKTKVFRLGD